jgi:hypothetical protein
MDKESVKALSPNQRIKRQQILEIWLPMALAIILCLAILVIAVLLAAPGGDTVSKMADIAIILMIIPLFTIFLVVIFLLLLINKSIGIFYTKLPAFFGKAQKTTAMIAAKIQSFAVLFSLPLIRFKSVSAGTKTFFHSTASRLMHRRNNE